MARSRKTEVDGILFDSKAESERYLELKLLEKAGEISDLTLQPEFPLQEGFRLRKRMIRPMQYTADFQYKRDGKFYVEDVKGHATEPYRIRRKLFLYIYGTAYHFVETKKVSQRRGHNKMRGGFKETVY
jgi:hypothetical protein